MNNESDLNEALKLIDLLEGINRQGFTRIFGTFDISTGRKEDVIKAEEMGSFATRKMVYKTLAPYLEIGLKELRLNLKAMAADALEEKATNLREELQPKLEGIIITRTYSPEDQGGEP